MMTNYLPRPLERNISFPLARISRFLYSIGFPLLSFNSLSLTLTLTLTANTYLPSRPFVSFRKVVLELAQRNPSYNHLELFSFHSVSKGVVGECGQRGGYVDCLHIDPDVIAEMYKVASISLCSNTSGQILVDLMVDPPKPGDPSYELYREETVGTYGGLFGFGGGMEEGCCDPFSLFLFLTAALSRPLAFRRSPLLPSAHLARPPRFIRIPQTPRNQARILFQLPPQHLLRTPRRRTLRTPTDHTPSKSHQRGQEKGTGTG